MTVNDLERRFGALVDVRGPEECWLWQGTRNGRGYGALSVPGRGGVPAHRLALELAGVEIPAGHHVHHRCGAPACCNPAHLEAVTPAEHGRRDAEAGYRQPVSKSVSSELTPLAPATRQQRDRLYAQALHRLEELERQGR